jgi:hypothetical protein
LSSCRTRYWAATLPFCLVALGGGVADLVVAPGVPEIMAHLGYPLYFCRLLGFWKLLGAAVVLAPGLPLLKEWAYAGFLINLTGAAVSHLAVGDPPANAVPALVVLALGAASWQLRPPDRRLGSTGAGA